MERSSGIRSGHHDDGRPGPSREPGPRPGERGAIAVEYGFLASLIAVVVIVSVAFIGERVLEIIESVLAWF